MTLDVDAKTRELWARNTMTREEVEAYNAQTTQAPGKKRPPVWVVTLDGTVGAQSPKHVDMTFTSEEAARRGVKWLSAVAERNEWFGSVRMRKE